MRLLRTILVCGALACSLLCPLGNLAASDDPVQVFTARKILTLERAAPEATAVAVAGGRIVAVGSVEEVRSASAHTRSMVASRAGY
jgi:hypothetical protein